MAKEATARIKINRLLEESGWRFFDNEKGKANIQLEPNVKLTAHDIDELGEDFEKVKNGFVDYLLLDENSRPFVVVEAKKSEVHPLEAKEQARNYANQNRAKYVILTNGEMHYFWNIAKGNPEIITTFPTCESLKESKALTVDPGTVINYKLDKYLVATSQDPTLEESSIWENGTDEDIFNYAIDKDLRVLRPYQLNAIKSVQQSIKEGKNRFLLEMATGTGKTLTSAGIIKMFIRSGLAHRVLFLIDRIELENQAEKDMKKYLAKDGIKSVVYKQNKQDWMSSDIVISTVQSFTCGDKYKKIFTPATFDLIISDEAHRSLSGNSRAVFEYFIGYKLGLTATPKNYLKNLKVDENDIREIERRKLLDTYHTFGCDSGNPTFSYTLKDGVEDKILVNPIIVDARTDITTELLSKEGLIVKVDGDEAEIIQEVNSLDYGKEEQIFNAKSFERKFFSDETNRVLCETFMKNALRDPITNEVGKSIIFCVNRKHAVKVTEILNQMADALYPNKYNSDFAVQITSNIPLAQDMTISFANNNLNGKTKFVEDYESSKTRIAVTVGMMTTGYDCRDILNVGLFRPIYSPSEFIQIKGRGTRIYDFKYEDIKQPKKTFKLFDYFAVCEFFEKEFKYDEVLKLPKTSQAKSSITGMEDIVKKEVHVKYIGSDCVSELNETAPYIMRIDKEYYTDFESLVKNNEQAKLYIDNEDVENLAWYIKENIFDKPTEYYNPKTLSTKLGLDRRLTIKEIVEKILGYIPGFKNRRELFEDEFDNFKLLNKDELSLYADKINDIKMLFEAYITNRDMREYMKQGRYNDLINSPLRDSLKNVANITIKNRPIIKYIVDYVLENDINCDKFIA